MPSAARGFTERLVRRLRDRGVEVAMLAPKFEKPAFHRVRGLVRGVRVVHRRVVEPAGEKPASHLGKSVVIVRDTAANI